MIMPQVSTLFDSICCNIDGRSKMTVLLSTVLPSINLLSKSLLMLRIIISSFTIQQRPVADHKDYSVKLEAEARFILLSQMSGEQDPTSMRILWQQMALMSRLRQQGVILNKVIMSIYVNFWLLTANTGCPKNACLGYVFLML